MRTTPLLLLVLAAGVAVASASNPMGGSYAETATGGSPAQMPLEGCAAKAEEMQSTILKMLAPCLAFEFAPDMCCNNIKSLVGPGGELSYCLCDETFFMGLEKEAAAFSIDVGQIGEACNDVDGLKSMIPFSDNAYCPPM